MNEIPRTPHSARVSPSWLTTGILYQILTWIDGNAAANVLSFERVHETERILVLINLSDKPAEITLPSIKEPVAPLLTRGAAGEPLNVFALGAYGFYIGKRTSKS